MPFPLPPQFMRLPTQIPSTYGWVQHKDADEDGNPMGGDVEIAPPQASEKAIEKRFQKAKEQITAHLEAGLKDAKDAAEEAKKAANQAQEAAAEIFAMAMESDDDEPAPGSVRHFLTKRLRASSEGKQPAKNKEGLARSISAEVLPPRLLVRVSSCGWKELGCQYNKDFDVIIKQRKGVIQKFKHKGWPKVDMWLDCRSLKSHPVKKLLWHCGRHTEIMRSILEHPNWPDLRDQVKKLVRDAIQSLSEELHIVFVCTSGAHRSVACRELTRHVLSRSGFQVEGEDYSSDSWAQRNLCHYCKECGDNKKKSSILRQVVRDWNTE